VHELLVGVGVAPPRAGDELTFVEWPAHHCAIYTERLRRVPPATRWSGRSGFNQAAVAVGALDRALDFYGRIFELDLGG
jgi:hypothetical protein